MIERIKPFIYLTLFIFLMVFIVSNHAVLILTQTYPPPGQTYGPNQCWLRTDVTSNMMNTSFNCAINQTQNQTSIGRNATFYWPVYVSGDYNLSCIGSDSGQNASTYVTTTLIGTSLCAPTAPVINNSTKGNGFDMMAGAFIVFLLLGSVAYYDYSSGGKK